MIKTTKTSEESNGFGGLYDALNHLVFREKGPKMILKQISIFWACF